MGNSMRKPRGIPMREFFAEQRKDPKYRKAEWELQWDANWHASAIVCRLRLSAGLSQNGLAKMSGKTQSSIARAESDGCSLQYLGDLAKSVGKKIIISIEDAEELK